MPKINVYLPDPLAEAVKAAGVSVSSVCQEALEREVERMKLIGATTEDLSGVASRLGLTEREDHDVEFNRGVELGGRWSREVASLSDLYEASDWHSRVFRQHPAPKYLYLPRSHSLTKFLLEAGVLARTRHGDDVRVDVDQLWRGILTASREVYTVLRERYRVVD